MKSKKTLDVDLPSGARVRVAKFDADRLSTLIDVARDLEKQPKKAMERLFPEVDKQVVEVLEWGPYTPMEATARTLSRVPWRHKGTWIDPDHLLEGDFNTICAGVYVAKFGGEAYKWQFACRVNGCTQALQAPIDVVQYIQPDELVPYSAEFLTRFKVVVESGATRTVLIGGKQHEVTNFDALTFDARFLDEDGHLVEFTWGPSVGRAGASLQQKWFHSGADSIPRQVAWKMRSLRSGPFAGPLATGMEDLDEKAYAKILASAKVEHYDIEVEGRNAVARALGKHDVEDLMKIADLWSEHEGGPNNIVEVECSSCGQMSETPIPFTQLFLGAVVGQRAKPKRGGRRRRRSSD